MTIFQKVFTFIGLILLHFFAARLVLFLSYGDMFMELNWQQVTFAFLQGFRFDLASICVFTGPFWLLYAVALRFSQRKVISNLIGYLIYLMTLTFICILGADIAYYAFVKRHITNEIVYMVTDLGYFVTVALVEYPWYLIAFILFSMVLLLIWHKILNSPQRGSKWWKTKFAMTVVVIFIAARGGVSMKPIAIIDAFCSGNTKASNLTLNGVFSSSHTILFNRDVNYNFFPKDRLWEILALKDSPQNPQYPLERRQPKNDQNQDPHLNLVIIMVESLSCRYVDVCGGKGYGVTPNIDRIAKNGVFFDRFFAHGQRSVDGLQAVLTGMPSLIGLPTIGTGIASRYTKLASIAKDNGYSNVFVSSMRRRAFRIDSVAGSCGFDNYYGKEDMPTLLDYPESGPQDLGWDYETLMFLGSKIDELKEPFIGFAFPSTDHTPYPKLPKRFTKYPHHEKSQGGYLNTLYYTDWAIGEFIKSAQNKSWFDNTIFVITGDHVIAHFQDNEFLNQFQIPCIVYAPKILKPQKISTVASQLDLLPTFIELLQLEGAYTTIGENLFDKEESFALVRQGSVIGAITDRGYLTHSLNTRLDSGAFMADPGEAYFSLIEKKLLAFNQLSYLLISKNMWAR